MANLPANIKKQVQRFLRKENELGPYRGQHQTPKLRGRTSDDVIDVEAEDVPPLRLGAGDVADEATGKQGLNRAQKFGLGAIGIGTAGKLMEGDQKDAAPLAPTPEEAEAATLPKAAGVAEAPKPADLAAQLKEYASAPKAPPSLDVGEAPGFQEAEPITYTDPDTGETKTLTEGQAIADYLQATNVAATEYKQAKSDLERREMWEAMINAAGKLVAGIVGLKTGLDLSGAKFERTDWAAKSDQLLRQMQADRAAAGERLQMSRALLEGRERTAARQEQAAARQWQSNATVAMKAADLAMNQQGLNNTERAFLFNVLKENNDEKWKQANYLLQAREVAAKEAGVQKQLTDKQAETAAKLDEEMSKLFIQLSDKIDKPAQQSRLLELRRMNERYKQLTGVDKYNLAKVEGLFGPSDPDVADIVERAEKPPLKPGVVMDGYRFLGGDPANPKSWEQVK